MPESVACALCGNPRSTPQPRKSAYLQVPDAYPVAMCEACGLIYLNPRPTVPELKELYHSHPYYRADNARRGAARTAFYDGRIARLEQHLPPGRMLGIGCLEGGCALKVARSRGWQVEAVDFSHILAEHARRELDLHVIEADGWDLSGLGEQRYDVVYTHSFEHFPNPRAMLRDIRARLRPGGVLMLEAPNQFYALKDKVKGAGVALFGDHLRKRMLGDVAPHFHLYYFGPKTLRALLCAEGFEVEALRTYLPRHPVYLRNPRARWLQEALYAVGGLVGRGPSMEVVARRGADGGAGPSRPG